MDDTAAYEAEQAYREALHQMNQECEDCEVKAQLAAAEEVIDLGEQFELAIGIDGCLEGGPCSLKERCKKMAPWSISRIQECCVELDKKRRAYRATYGKGE